MFEFRLICLMASHFISMHWNRIWNWTDFFFNSLPGFHWIGIGVKLFYLLTNWIGMNSKPFWVLINLDWNKLKSKTCIEITLVCGFCKVNFKHIETMWWYACEVRAWVSKGGGGDVPCGGGLVGASSVWWYDVLGF